MSKLSPILLSLLAVCTTADARHARGAVSALSSPQITTSTITAPAIGATMAQTLTITGGSGNYACSAVSVQPNMGLWNYITPGCTVSGTPEMVEPETAVYQVTDTSTGLTATKSFTFTPTNSGSLSILSGTAISGPSGGYTSYHLKTSGGLTPYWYTSTVASPCTVSYDGVIECAAAANQSIPLTVTDGNGTTATQTETLTVNSTLTLQGIDNVDGLLHLPPAIAGSYYQTQLGAFAGSGTGFVYTATSGLPAWETLTTSGELYGTPTQSGAVEIALKVTDSSSNTATATGLQNVASNGTVSRPSYNPTTASGFFQLGGKLYDPNGKPFTIRGENQLHYNSSAATGIPQTSANAVRIWDGNCTASNYTSLISGYVADGIFPIATVSYVPTSSTTCGATETTGDNSPTDLASVVSWWTANESSFAPYMESMAINIANEWGPAYSTTWQSSYASAISALRTAGYTCPIVIDSGGSGQDVFDVYYYGPALEADDPLQNVVFSIHVYGQTFNLVGYISGVTSSGGNTILTMNSTASANPLWPYGGTDTYASGYTVAGVQGMTQLNGAWPGSSTVGGSSGAWTATLTVNSSGFSPYTGGGLVYANSTPSPSSGGSPGNMAYQAMAQSFAALGSADNMAVIFGEVGPGTGGTTMAIGPSPTSVSFQQMIGAAEAYGLGWIQWAIDDNSGTGGTSSFFGWFGQTLNGPGSYSRATPNGLTATGLDGIPNPKYGFYALATPAPYLH